MEEVAARARHSRELLLLLLLPRCCLLLLRVWHKRREISANDGEAFFFKQNKTEVGNKNNILSKPHSTALGPLSSVVTGKKVISNIQEKADEFSFIYC